MKLVRKILKGVSLTAAMFVFQACYGPMEDYYDTKVTFHVVAEDTGEPLQDVRIWAQELNNSDSADIGNQRHLAEYTDGNGFATVWIYDDLIRYSFEDKDSLYVPVDTIINPAKYDTVEIVLHKLD